MHILFVVPYTPNLIRVRPYNLIRSLAANGNKISVLTIYSEESELKDLEELRNYCHLVQGFFLPRWKSYWNCLKALPSSKPLQSQYCWHPELASRIKELLSSAGDEDPIDIVHIEHLRGVQYGLYIKTLDNFTPVVWDSVDSISYLFEQASAFSTDRLSRYITKFELARTKKFENKMVGRFDRLLVTSNIDQNAYITYSENNKAYENINIVPNGVDLEYFNHTEYIEREPNSIIISGKMSYHANISMVTFFVEKIFPIIKNNFQGVRLWIVGKDPPEKIVSYGQNASIEVTGMVPDIRPYLQKAIVSVTPLTYGAGIQLKVLEAMACATPVVSTSKATNPLSVIPDQDILIADDEPEFARKVIRLLNNPSLQRKVGLAGRRYVENNHHWGSIATRLEGIYNEIIYPG
jgi:glycosyltransferase involved in cell wall biosynthesis